MSARRHRAASASHYVTLLAIACAVGIGVALWAPWSRPKVTALCTATAIPEHASFSGDAWYWIERRKDAVDLVRADGSRAVVASAADIGGFATNGHGIAWSERNGSRWSVRWSEKPGAGATTLYEGPGPALGVWTDGAMIAFLAPADDQGVRAPAPNPSVGPKTALYVAERRSGEAWPPVPRTAATVAEAFTRAQVLGKHGNAFLVLGVREGGIPVSVLYRVEAAGETRRLLGEAGYCAGTRSSDGSILIKAPSRESNDSLTSCIMRVDPETGAVRVVADWMPSGGMPAETRTGIAAWSDQSPAVWLTDGATRASRMLSISDSHVPIGLAHDRVLLLARGNTPGHARIAWAPLR